ncbi:MAG: flagellar basal-body MS-ring/collar protein FliF [Pseudomonadota bacterium]
MEKIKTVFLGIPEKKRIAILVGLTAVIALISLLGAVLSENDEVLLYGGLEAEVAGEVVEALEQRGVPYSVRGASIFVEPALRDTLRLSLAGEGLPAPATRGYEILDELSGFGTTSQMFDAAYWRAKEGELARTIATLPLVKAARVHISASSPNPFQRNPDPSASVVLQTSGAAFPASGALAVRHLVASSVANLSAENVSIVDGSGRLLGADGEGDADAPKREGELRDNILRLLEARVGPGNVVVEVNLQKTQDSESIIERIFDPNGSVPVSTEVEEMSNTSTGRDVSTVDIASNLPDFEEGEGGSLSESENTSTRERTNFEISETLRELVRAPGAVRRVDVAVLVNEVLAVDEDGAETWSARSEEELQSLRELVESTVGFDAARGDTITIKSLRLFEAEAPEISLEPNSQPVLAASTLNRLLQIGSILIALAIVSLFIIRPSLKAYAEGSPAIGAEANEQISGPDQAFEVLEDSAFPNEPAALDLEPGGFSALEDIVPDPGFQYEEDYRDRLYGYAKDKQSDTVEILKAWVGEASHP